VPQGTCKEEIVSDITESLENTPRYGFDPSRFVCVDVVPRATSLGLLDYEQFSDEAREYAKRPPMPGLAYVNGPSPERLTQDETDALILCDLYTRLTAIEQAELCALQGPPMAIKIHVRARIGARHYRLATEQRNGLHSDPLIRALAYVAWGMRDMWWLSIGAPRLTQLLCAHHATLEAGSAIASGARVTIDLDGVARADRHLLHSEWLPVFVAFESCKAGAMFRARRDYVDAFASAQSGTFTAVAGEPISAGDAVVLGADGRVRRAAPGDVAVYGTAVHPPNEDGSLLVKVPQ
jgi:hypothetical protein